MKKKKKKVAKNVIKTCHFSCTLYIVYVCVSVREASMRHTSPIHPLLSRHVSSTFVVSMDVLLMLFRTYLFS